MDLDRVLNPQQREAVIAPDGPTLVLAGAGSGKTRVLTYRVAHLIERGVDPWRILAVTFTNKAAGEMRARVERLLGPAARDVWMGTFHSVAVRLLRAHGATAGLDPRFVIFDDDDSLALITRILKDQRVPERLFAPRAIAAHIDRAKNQGLGPGEYRAADILEDVVASCYTEYELRMRASNALDFGDLLLGVLRIGAHPEAGERLRSRFAHVLVDEYQDTNRVQYLIAHALATTGSIFAVGDPDQSIYAFRGADLRNVLDFEQDFPDGRVLRLEQNYRSTPLILKAASAVIAHNVSRYQKDLWTENPEGPLPLLRECDDERDEAQWIVSSIRRLRGDGYRLGDVAVFYRTHAQSRAIEEQLRYAHLGYLIIGGVRFYERAEIKDAIAYVRVLVNPRDSEDLRRIANVPTRGIGDTTMERIEAHAKERSTTLWEAMRDLSRDTSDTLKVAARKKLAAFVTLMEELRDAAGRERPSRVIELILERSGYLERLAIEGTPEAQGRSDNLRELLASVQEYESSTSDASLSGFLERVTLQSAVDELVETEGRASLMTIHSAKGLEFPVVFIAGLEENLFPHSRSLLDESAIEEERRLFYVAMTRAQRHLHLSHARMRRLYAQPTLAHPSRFLAEIPADCLTAERTSRPKVAPTYGRWVDAHDSQLDPGLPSGMRVGMRVRHATFGDGILRGSTGGGDDAKLTIDFPGQGRKTIIARFVKPASAP